MIGADFKRLFFDRKAVRAKTDRATRRVLSRFGAYVRRSARSSIRKRKRTSAPGSPPSSHAGLLRKFIFFGFDLLRRSVVIGPARLSRRGRGEAPSLLEHGGTGTVAAAARKGKAASRKRVRYRPRPYMGPALTREKPKLPAMWRGSVK